jgi:UDP-N-acetylglucosamine--N-acetylmuramyl-(pentapeptide) pyrophosphoryl-undecaprenol N-acetylglucosamine transferase
MKVVIATGGSGGHLFPALKVAQSIRQLGHDVVFVGSFGLGVEKIVQSGFAHIHLEGRGLKTSSLKEIIISIFFMIRALWRALRNLMFLKPHVVIGFGGYGAFPVVLSAWALFIPTLIHEQNVVPGRANKLLSRLVRKIAISFKESVGYWPKGKTVLTGCPCHVEYPNKDKDAIYQEFNLRPHRPTILVFGGSQGSQKINQTFLEAIPLLKNELDFQVIHASGKADLQQAKSTYQHFDIPVALFEFLDKMGYAYAIADVVIARAGAVTVTELAMFGAPAILIPYPHAQGHQKQNAAVLVNEAQALLLEERDLTAAGLKHAIVTQLKAQLKKSASSVYVPDAAYRIACEALKLNFVLDTNK